MLEAGFGSEVTVRIDGEDEFAALEAIEQVIDKRQFDED
jgi:phosphotransferase system HPr-like phosphotransfer protein